MKNEREETTMTPYVKRYESGCWDVIETCEPAPGGGWQYIIDGSVSGNTTHGKGRTRQEALEAAGLE